MTEQLQNRTIRVSALVLRRGDELLMVRKRGTRAYMLPGGKPEPGELPIDTALREAHEELGLDMRREDLDTLGTFEAAAANEEGHRVVGDVFVHRTPQDLLSLDDLRPQAEIDDARWFDMRTLPEDSDVLSIAPLTRMRVVPALASHATSAEQAH